MTPNSSSASAWHLPPMIIMGGTAPICACCGGLVADRDVKVSYVRDAYDRSICLPDLHSQECMLAVKRLMEGKKIMSESKVIYFCKTCLPELPMRGNNA
jgi:hypothetical protein